MTTHDTSIRWTQCPVCGELHREYEQASAAAEKAWDSYTSVDFQYREARDDGRVVFATPAWLQWHDLLDSLLHAYHAAEDAKRASLAAWGESIREHPAPQAKAAAAPAPAETEEMPMLARDVETPADGEPRVDALDAHVARWQKALREQDAAAVADDTDDVEEPLYLCGGFLHAQAERHATAERHKSEEDDVLRNAVRAIEHGDTAPIREFSYGSRQGRRDALRELRELLDDMIADIDEDTEEGAQ